MYQGTPRSNPKSILDLISANWISCFWSRDNNTYFTELIWELHEIKYAKHRKHCLANHRGSTNVSFYLFSILSNGISYFILYIKPNTRRREMSGYACSTNCLGRWKLRWVTKMKNILPNRVQRDSEMVSMGKASTKKENMKQAIVMPWESNGQFDLLCIYYIQFICCLDYKPQRGHWGWRRTVHSTAISSRFFLLPTSPDAMF